MLETRLEVDKVSAAGIQIKNRVQVGGKDMIVVGVEEDANDPIINVRCGPEDL